MTNYQPITENVRRNEAEAAVIMLRRAFGKVEVTFRLAAGYTDTNYRYDVLAAKCNAERRAEMRGFLMGAMMRSEYAELAGSLVEA
jgi:hypothetical protein